MRNEKLINAFFEAIKDVIFESNPDLKKAIKYQLKIEEIKLKIASRIGNKEGSFTLIHKDISVGFCQGKARNINFTFIVNDAITDFKEEKTKPC